MKRSDVRLMLTTSLILLVISCYCQESIMRGGWVIKEGRITKNYELANPYSSNKILFMDDSVKLSSGFFYRVDNPSEELVQGRFSFIYYGNFEKYKVKNDSLYIYSRPYNRWNVFKIEKISKNRIALHGDNLFASLVKDKTTRGSKSCNIEFVKVEVYSGNLHNVHFETWLGSNDSLYFTDLTTTERNKQIFKLKPSLFKDICVGFSGVDLKNIKKIYKPETSSSAYLKLEIGLSNGTVIKSQLYDNYPEELRLALIPIIYAHQRFLFPNVKAVE